MRWAALGARWRACTCASVNIRMHVMHNYVIPSRDALEFAKLVERIEADALSSIESVSSARRPLLAYGAAVLEEIIRQANPREIVISALGVREGLLFESLSPEDQAKDPLLVAASEFNRLRSRAPAHAEELFHWTSGFLEDSHLEETAEEKRLRRAACLLSDVAWRAHPDYRAEQSHDLISNADIHRHRSPRPRLSRPRGFLPSCIQRSGNRRDLAVAGVGASTRSGAGSRRRDARRLYPFGGDAGRAAACSDVRAERQGVLTLARRPRPAQQRPTANPPQAVRAADRRRPRDSGRIARRKAPPSR